jgi:hypothetical protein
MHNEEDPKLFEKRPKPEEVEAKAEAPQFNDEE